MKNKKQKPSSYIEKRTRKDIVDNLNTPNYQESMQMKREGISWHELRKKLKIPIYT